MESGERAWEKVFPNGDVYLGNFEGKVPHGKGKYTWSDGTVYDGEWEEGQMTGRGRMSWSSGATYEGDFSGGCLHGFGTFTSSDGSVYEGAWKMNTKHGIGRKQYQNSDVYDGGWKEGLREGSGKYIWNNGNKYIGNWKNGGMCGRGVMKWFNGDLFDGFWLNGLRHGSGCCRFADGSYYFGTWTKDLKDGRGTFFPAGSEHLSSRKHSSQRHEDKRKRLLSHSESMKPNALSSLSERMSNLFLKRSGRIPKSSSSSNEKWGLDDSVKEYMSLDTSWSPSYSYHDGQGERRDNSVVAFQREYIQGVLIKERIREISGHKKKTHPKFHAIEMKKKSHNERLMLNLQLGIRNSVGKITSVPRREVRLSDFGKQARIRRYFPQQGSQLTPPHHSVDFYWKDYCPLVFRNLRELFKLNTAEYMMSICGDDGLKELSSPGKSGSIFYLSRDDKFFIKTLKKSEVKVLIKMLPGYYEHVYKHENTLITKFFGLHQIALKHGRKVRFIVMGNMHCTELRIHRSYDLKGSTHGRFTNKDQVHERTTLKDLDLTYEFHMDKLLRESLFKQLSSDCDFLESQQIIDYSLLLGLHYRAPGHLKSLLEPPDSLHKLETPTMGDGPISEGECSVRQKGLLLVEHEPHSVNRAPGPHIRGNSLRASSLGDKEVDLFLPDTGRLRIQLGVNMPAQATQKLLQDETESGEVELFEIYDVILFLGIIDILQEYNVRKKLERKCKSLQFDPTSISVMEPKLYSLRFINFLEKVFPIVP